MVERVARALMEYERLPLPVADRMARAAIAAMREPTGAQIDAALLCGPWSMNTIPRLERAWRAMIDEALGEDRR